MFERTWSKKDERTVVLMMNTGSTAKEVSKCVIGRTPGAIQAKYGRIMGKRDGSDVKTDKNGKVLRYHNRHWTEAECRILVSMQAAGSNYSTIGEVLERTRDACGTQFRKIVADGDREALLTAAKNQESQPKEISPIEEAKIIHEEKLPFKVQNLSKDSGMQSIRNRLDVMEDQMKTILYYLEAIVDNQ